MQKFAWAFLVLGMFSALPTLADDVASPKVDILWVIDNSGSMDSNQQKVRVETQAFIDVLSQSKKLDWKLGLISSDLMDVPYVGFAQGDTLDSHSPDAVQRFMDSVVRLGTNGDGVEKGLSPIAQALTKFPDFLRPGAKLEIIFLTDASDQGNVGDLPDLLALLQKAPGLKNVMSFGIYGAQDMGCKPTDDPWNYQGSTYQQFVTQTHGFTYPLCQISLHAPILDIAHRIVLDAGIVQ